MSKRLQKITKEECEKILETKSKNTMKTILQKILQKNTAYKTLQNKYCKKIIQTK